MNDFDFFDRIYCIHLPNPERRRHIEGEFSRLGLRHVEFVHAEPAPADFKPQNMRRDARGHWSASLSHVKAWIHALNCGAYRPLFIEDDVAFCEDAHAALAAVKKDLPYPWRVLFLGGHPRENVRKVGEHLVTAGLWSICECYAVHGDALAGLAEYWCDRTTQPDAMVDFIIGEYAARGGASFAAFPQLTTQRPGVSQITGDWVDTHELVARAWKNHL